ncbi:phage major capsid protein [Leucobacter sp. GX0328]
MTTPTITAMFSASTALFADAEARTVRGLLLPFGELSAPSVDGTDPIMFSAGTVELPADPSIVSINSGSDYGLKDHSQFANVGRATEIVETAEGIVAEFAIARTAEGDKLLARATSADLTARPRLSAEIAGLVRRGAQAVKARLTGAAACSQGAFASAAMFSAVDAAVEVLEDEAPAEDLDDDAKDTLVADVTAAVLKALETEGTDTDTDTPTDPAPKEETMTASVPSTLRTPGKAPADSTTAVGLFAALTTARRTGDRSGLEDYLAGEAAFAIANINHAGPSGATISDDIAQPAYIGQLWNRKKYERRFFPLCGTETLTSFEINGWKFAEGKEPVVAAYAGNGAEIPSNAVDTEPVKATARRIAGGHRIDRRFTDFPDQGFWQAYFDSMVESYARVSDLDALSTMVTAATAVTAAAVPANVAPALAAVVDGALAIIATENSPAFAVVSPELWRDIVLTGRDEVLGYLSASFGLEEGSAGGFRILPGPVGTGKVLVGAREARTMYELPGSPIRVEGLVPANGQIEPALYGYIGDVTHNAKALALVTPPAAG